MKKLLSSLFLVVLTAMSGQDKPSLVGRWQTVSVTDPTHFAARKDSVVLLDGIKRSKVSEQDNKASVRTLYAKNVFVFSAAGDFLQYYSDNPRTLVFEGQFTNPENGELILNLKNRAKQRITITAQYRFESGQLHLKMYSNRTYPIEYVLERVTE